MSDRIYEQGAAADPPSPPANPSSGYPTPGDPASGIPATKPGPWWFHMITEEIRNTIVQAGLTPDHTDLSQLSQAVQGLASGIGRVATGAAIGAGVSPGDVVRWDAAAGEYVAAVADGTGNDAAVGVADVDAGQVIFSGVSPAIFSGLVAGATYYLDPTTPGAVTETKPADAVRIGVALSSTEMLISVGRAAAGLISATTAEFTADKSTNSTSAVTLDSLAVTKISETSMLLVIASVSVDGTENYGIQKAFLRTTVGASVHKAGGRVGLTDADSGNFHGRNNSVTLTHAHAGLPAGAHMVQLEWYSSGGTITATGTFGAREITVIEIEQ